MATVPDDDLNGTLAALLERIGDVPPHRIRMEPLPGTATEADVLAALEAPRKRICELVDGVLVEKAVGARESQLGLLIGHSLLGYLMRHRLGIVLGADGLLKLMPGLIRAPDVSFIPIRLLTDGALPEDTPIPELVPDLAVEVLSKSNTKAEMRRKRKDLFLAGAKEVWEVDPKTQTADVYSSPTKKRHVGKTGSLTGGTILPGFTLSLAELFGSLRA